MWRDRECANPSLRPIKQGRGNRFPAWLVAMTLVGVAWSVFYVARNAGAFSPVVYEMGETPAEVLARVPKDDSMSPMRRGRRLYGTYCAACHQWHGRGIPEQFPPLTQSEWVLASGPNRIIRIVLDGMDGAVTIRGQEYNSPMLPWRELLNDEEIASVLTFVRCNKQWNHAAEPVTPEQVRRIRSQTADRTSYWTAEELNSVPESD
ncbi:MAG: cytochrome c [Verrucomicrobiota bacterium]|nr:cytochrome c [Verrucomicrobiota bacterium]